MSFRNHFLPCPSTTQIQESTGCPGPRRVSKESSGIDRLYLWLLYTLPSWSNSESSYVVSRSLDEGD